MTDATPAKRGGFLFPVFAIAAVLVTAIYFLPSDAALSGASPSALPSPTGVPSEIASLSGPSFQQNVASGIHVVDFWAEWCGPCRVQGPIVDQLARNYAGSITVGKVDVDREGGLAQQYGVQALPTIIIFKNGREAARFVGLTQEADLAQAVRNLM